MELEHPLFVNLPRAMEAFSDYPGNSTDRQVFAVIAQFANRYGVSSCMTTRSIAARIGRRREEVSKSVNRIAKRTGLFRIVKEKRGQDKHPRNVYCIIERVIRRHPDKRSSHYNAAAWKRWCEIGKKRFYNALKRKQAAQAAAGTFRDTAARMAGGKRPTTASASPTPAQAREARQQRGGGFAELGDALRGMGLLGAPTAAAPAVKDTYKTENQQRGDLLQQLRQHEAQQQAAAAPIQQPPTQPTASEQRERKAQAYEELQSLRERLRRQATAPMTDTTTAASMAARDVARDYARASRPAEMASLSRWPATTTQPVQLIQRPAPTPAVEREAQAARDYWKRKLREHEARQQAAAAMGEAR